MAENSINVPITIVDEASDVLRNIQKNVDSLASGLANIEKVSKSASKVESSFKDAGKAIADAGSKADHAERLFNRLTAKFDEMRKKNESTNAVLKLFRKTIESLKNASGFNRLLTSIEKVNQGVRDGDSKFIKLLRSIDNIANTGAFRRINRTLDLIRSKVNGQNNLIGKTRAISSTVLTLFNRKKLALETLKNRQKSFNNAIQQGKNVSSGMLSNLKGIIATYAGFETVTGIVGMSDTLSNTTARLNMINDGSQTTAELQEKIFQASQKSRGSYDDIAESVAKLGLLAGDAFKTNDEALGFATTLQQMFAICGTDANNANAAMLQLTQALGSGKLQGDEFRSVMEACPMICQTIADYMGVSKGELKDLSSEGKITADILKNALLKNSEEINKQFNEMPYTWSQIWTTIKNGFGKTMQPVLTKISDLFNENKDKITAFADSLSSYITKIIDGLVDFAGEFVKLAGDKGVHEFFDSLIYYFTGMARTLIAIGKPIGTFLNKLSEMGILAPLLAGLATGFLAIAFIVNVVSGVMLYASHAVNILIGVFGAISKIIQGVIFVIKVLALVTGVSIGWIVVAILAVIAVVALLWVYWDEVKAFGIKCWNALAEGVTSAFNVISNVLSGIWNAIVNAFSPIFPFLTAIWSFISAVFTGIGSIIWAILSGIWGWVSYIWGIVYSYIAEKVSWIWSCISTGFQAVADFCGNIWATVRDAIVGVWDSIVDVIGEYVSGIYQKGKDFVQGFIDGVTDKIKDATDAVKELCSSAVDAIDNFFKIGSPSKLMKEMGSFVGQGFNIGLEGEIPNARRNANKFAYASLQGVGSGATSNTTNNNVSPKITINMTASVSNDADIDEIVRKIAVKLNEAMNKSARGVFANV